MWSVESQAPRLTRSLISEFLFAFLGKTGQTQISGSFWTSPQFGMNYGKHFITKSDDAKSQTQVSVYKDCQNKLIGVRAPYEECN